MKLTFDDNILLSLRRQYSKDESFNYLLSEISKLKFKIGELQSENAELQDQLSKLKADVSVKSTQSIKTEIPPLSESKKQFKKDQYVAQLLKQISTQGKTNAMINKDRTMWMNKFFDIQNRLEKLGLNDNA